MKKAFTLAEVLITLAIIGIVAAVTIPSVIANAQQQQFKTGLRKAVSVLNEAILLNITVEGETPYENLDLLSYLSRHMSVTKSGAYNEQRKPYGDNKFLYTTDGIRFEFSNGPRSNLKLHENNQFQLRGDGLCGSLGLANKHDTKEPPCIILVDVNGERKPNPIIKEALFANGMPTPTGVEGAYQFPSPNDKRLTDVFNILITEDRAIPFGVVAQRAMYQK